MLSRKKNSEMEEECSLASNPLYADDGPQANWYEMLYLSPDSIFSLVCLPTCLVLNCAKAMVMPSTVCCNCKATWAQTT